MVRVGESLDLVCAVGDDFCGVHGGFGVGDGVDVGALA